MLLTISISLTDEGALVRDGYSLWPGTVSFDAYKLAFKNPQQIIRSYEVTAFYSLMSTGLGVMVMGLMAYPLSRPNFRFKKFVTFYVFFTMLFSGGMVPSYLLITKYLHLDNNILVYILPHMVSAWNIIIIRTNYQTLPNELFDAAEIDGASEAYICFRIVMPLCKPVLASVGFLFLVPRWNDWQTSLLYITDPDLYSLQYILQRILREANYLKSLADSGDMSGNAFFPTESFKYAMALIAAGPVLVAFPFFQKHFAKGLTIGAVKG